jgi:hypothetical protein
VLEESRNVQYGDSTISHKAEVLLEEEEGGGGEGGEEEEGKVIVFYLCLPLEPLFSLH